MFTFYSYLFTWMSKSCETSPCACVYCNSVNKLDNTKTLYEDDDVAVFYDFKPASRFHVIIVPKRHIEDIKALTPKDKVLVTKMLKVAKEMVVKNNLSCDDARFGYHWPPFRSVKHLHLHAIAPESEMDLISKMRYMKNSYWFISPSYLQSILDSSEVEFPLLPYKKFKK